MYLADDDNESLRVRGTLSRPKGCDGQVIFLFYQWEHRGID